MTDVSITKNNDLAVFVFNQDNLAERPKPLGAFGSSIVSALEKNRGDLNPIVVPDPITGEYTIVDTVRSAPSLGSMSIMEKLHPYAATYLEQAYEVDCDKAFLIKIDCAGRKDDPSHFDSVYVIEGVRMNNIAHDGDLQSFTENTDTGVQLTSDMNLVGWKRIYPLRFAQTAAAEVLAEIVDVIFADAISCGACAPYSAGDNGIYALQVANTGSPGLSAQIVFTVNGGTSWTALDIPTLGGVTANAIVSVGSQLVVFSEAYGGHAVVEKANLSASSTFTGVTTGYNASGKPRVAYVQSVANVIIGGAGGYIYQTDAIGYRS